MKRSVTLALFCMFLGRSIAQNNPIFNGGNADGWEKTGFQQASNNIFTGGNADGFSIAIYQQAGNNIFAGGNSDGWSSISFAQASNNIYGGGNGDGWDRTSFAQSANNIFFGGIGDGWASTYRPQGPLPVTFEYFTATKSGTSALLKWKTSQEINSAYFDIERSGDAISFVKIGSVTAGGNSTVPLLYSFTDNAPLSGLDYYRIRQVDADGHFVNTPTRVLNFGAVNAAALRYYPNPTNGLLNIQLTEALQKETKVVNIFNETGIVVSQLKIGANSSNILTVDLNKYAKGIYFIQVRTATTNSTQRVVLQ